MHIGPIGQGTCMAEALPKKYGREDRKASWSSWVWSGALKRVRFSAEEGVTRWVVKGLAWLGKGYPEESVRKNSMPTCFFPTLKANLRNWEWETNPGSLLRAFLEGRVFLSLLLLKGFLGFLKIVPDTTVWKSCCLLAERDWMPDQKLWVLREWQ